ncbi:uncharacterized protein BDW43DRAFT_310583 [Aspergillus alliaceus]|uniref:uncharacterized protein n=1 Tax=Petromyces alliaceus TaxID=209559 RepID=UPI0012A6340C|nr:uncharacterized protein BDW43DRAFT_310583 [Aspergillus alliaceus]KAB8234234.1 hypothetical protein BDW43DRAFT_310583 [Aspergillus alliaceus]
MLQAERGSFSLLLIDWTHDLSDTIFERYIQTAAFPNCVDTVLANGLGRVECLPKYMLDAGSGLGLSVGSTATSHTSASAIQTAFAEMDSNGNASDSLYGNGTVWEGSSSNAATYKVGEMTMTGSAGYNICSLPPKTCENTTSSRLTIPANASLGWLALNLVNSGAVSALRVSLDGHLMHVYAADGLYVTPQEAKADGMDAITSQVSVDPASTWMLTNGSASQGVTELVEAKLSPFEGSGPPLGLLV